MADSKSKVTAGLASFDSLLNWVSGLGTSRDKAANSQYQFVPLDRGQLEAAYRADWVARKVVDIPAYDQTREWRNWQAEQDQIEKIEAVERSLRIQRRTMLGLRKSRLYGGGALVMGVNDGPQDQQLDLEKIKQGDLKFVHAVSQYQIATGPLETNPLSEFFDEPTYYEVRSLDGKVTRVHPSRVVRLVGADLPDSSVPTSGGTGWGDSVLQAVDDAIKNVGLTTGSVASLVSEAKTDVVRIPGLMEQIGTTQYQSKLSSRFGAANVSKSIINTLLLDKEEEWDRINTDFTWMPEVLKVYLLIASGAADIPATRMLGQSAMGLNATGEGDTRNYYDRIRADQTSVLSPAMIRLDEAIIRSALGQRDPDIYYEWAPLWQLDEVQQAELAYKKASTFQIDVNSGVMNVDALRKGRENQLIEDGVYPGFEGALKEFEDSELDEDDDQVSAQFSGAAGNEEAVADARRVKSRRTGDARPRTLYVRRDVLNKAEIYAWAKKQGLAELESDLHVTIAFSRAPVDWMQMEPDYYGSAGDGEGTMMISAGGARLMDRFGEGALVLLFNSSALSWRHEMFKQRGASWDYPDYQPHITITYSREVDPEEIDPYKGKIELGPEIFEEVETNRRAAA